MGNAFKLRNGSLLLSTEAPGGIYNSTQLKKIATLTDEESAIIKVTEDQRLALFVKEDQAEAIANELRAVGLGIRHYQDGLHQPTTCIGELCPEHKQDALGTAIRVGEELAQISLSSPLRIGINGCARCCVPCHTLDISLVGDEGGYRISLGGKNSQLPEMATFVAESVPEEELPQLLRKILDLYKEYAEGGESLQDVMDRVGMSKFAAALAPYSQDAAGDGMEMFQDAGDVSVSAVTAEMAISPPETMEMEMEMAEEIPLEEPAPAADSDVELAVPALGEAEIIEDELEVLPPDLAPQSDFEAIADEDEEVEIELAPDAPLPVDAVAHEGEEQDFEDKLNQDISATAEGLPVEDDGEEEERSATLSLVEGVADAGSLTQSSEQWAFEAFSYTDQNEIVLSFSSGANLQVNPSLLAEGRKSFRLGDSTVTFERNGQEIIIELADGLKMILPARPPQAA